jgi:hypothetical protein
MEYLSLREAFGARHKYMRPAKSPARNWPSGENAATVAAPGRVMKVHIDSQVRMSINLMALRRQLPRTADLV